MQPFPHPRLGPVAQASPARHPAATAELFGLHLPGNAALQDKDDPRQRGAVADAAWSPTFGLGRLYWQQRREDLPQPVADEWRTHAANLPHSLGSVRRS
jgi:hypothetical protein